MTNVPNPYKQAVFINFLYTNTHLLKKSVLLYIFLMFGKDTFS